MYGQLPVFYIKVINVTGLNAEFVPLLLVLISEFFTVLMIYQCVKEWTHFQINFGWII